MSLYINQIEQLVELQKVDDQIHVIRNELTSAPKEIEDLKTAFSRLEDERTRVQDKLNHLQEQKKRLNLDIEDEAGRIKKSKSKLMQAANTREYQAMMREMDSLEKMSRDHEEEKNLMVEELTRVTEAFADVDQRHGGMQAELSEKEANLSERTEKARNELKNLDERRRETSKDIPLPVLARYEFIRERLEYPVIVPVSNGVCSGCNIFIPPQSYIELQKGKQILSCPNCQRLIYWNEHFTEE